MKIINFLLVVSILAVSLANEDNKEEEKVTCPCGWSNSNKKRIAGGKETEQNAYPWMVSIQGKKKRNHFCGGSIITEWHVLTAAQCTKGIKPSKTVICVGGHDNPTCGEDDTSKYYNVYGIYNHPDFTISLKLYDISVLATKIKIIFSPNIGPACFPNTKITNQLDGYTVRVTGWEFAWLEPKEVDILKELDLTVVPYLECKLDHPNIEESSQICTRSSQGNTCFGDCGGPLVWFDPDIDRYTLIGIVSYKNLNCMKKNVPTINTNVSEFHKWIMDKIKSCSSVLVTVKRQGTLCMKKVTNELL